MSHEPDLSPFVPPRRPSLWKRAAVRRLAFAAALATLCSLPLASDGALSNACKAPPAEPDLEGGYPAQASSPLQSLHDHDVVFYGEVVVPTRPCSLGYCAGLKVLSALKGQVEKTVLITVANAQDDRCGPDLFQHKGVKWVVFADTGTSKTGIKYMHAGFEGPSYASVTAPNFPRLEADYRNLRAQLDNAIEARLGRPTRTR